MSSFFGGLVPKKQILRAFGAQDDTLARFAKEKPT